MPRRISVKKKDKVLSQDICLKLLDEFIRDSYNGRRTKKDGSRITYGTVRNYTFLRKALEGFIENAGEWKIFVFERLTMRERERAGNFNKKFYQQFTQYLYLKKGYFDNYVGLIIKNMRIFYNYLELERNIPVGVYHKSFYVPSEEIPIIALNPEQLRYILNDKGFNERVQEKSLEKIRDIFVFGCTVALRVSDLLSLTQKNLIIENGVHYLRVKSKKTHTYTSVKLPTYALEILFKYKDRRGERGKVKTLLPSISAAYLNSSLKKMAALLEDNFVFVKTRERRGKQIVVYKDPIRKAHYTLADHISTHTMRRTAITNMLSLGMPEHLVRKISGHSANSREFFRYVELAQSYIDQETDRVFERLAS
ncbi:MAG: tyrosine-type recombinase/integrase [Bacteroidota bacterium]